MVHQVNECVTSCMIFAVKTRYITLFDAFLIFVSFNTVSSLPICDSQHRKVAAGSSDPVD